MQAQAVPHMQATCWACQLCHLYAVVSAASTVLRAIPHLTCSMLRLWTPLPPLPRSFLPILFPPAVLAAAALSASLPSSNSWTSRSAHTTMQFGAIWVIHFRAHQAPHLNASVAECLS